MNPTDSEPATWAQLLPLIVGPAVVAALLTAMITVTLHLVSIWRENKYRYAADRRATYVELLAALQDLDNIRSHRDRIRRTMQEPGYTPSILAVMLVEHGLATDETIQKSLATTSRARSSEVGSAVLDESEATMGRDAVELALIAAASSELAVRRARAEDQWLSALAGVRLLAPHAVIKAVGAVYDQMASDTPNTEASIRSLTDTMRKDLGLDLWPTTQQ